MATRRGWYRLPHSGQPYHGPIPPGATEIPAPSVEAGEELVDLGESFDPVRPDVPGLQLPAGSLEVGASPGGGGGVDEKSDDQVGHGPGA
jgi:hypothetical protein